MFKPSQTEVVSSYPKVYPRSQHCISRAQISDNALKVLHRLEKSGYEAYLVGGCVRDLLLGREPKDFDVVTSAHPEQVRAVFKNSRLIGRRFRLAHVYFGREIIEVATFRSSDNRGTDSRRVLESGMLLRDNSYGTIEEDVWRRDFSVNALYYNIHDLTVIDFVGGMEDHQAGSLRLLGDPEVSYREDPVRMLRAIRFATKLGFSVHPSCAEPIQTLSSLLKNIPAARLYDEIVKLFLSGYAVQTFELLRHYHLFEILFPETEKALSIEKDGFPLTFLAKALENTDLRLSAGKPVTQYFLFAAILWEPMRSCTEKKIIEGQNEILAIQEAASEVISKQVKRTAFPRRVTLPMREVWNLQPRLKRRTGVRPFRLLSHPRFRAAYDFLLLRAETGEADPALADWWTRFQNAGDAEKRKMTRGSIRHSGKRRRKKKTSIRQRPQIVP